MEDEDEDEDEDVRLAFCHAITFDALMRWVAHCTGKTARALGVPSEAAGPGVPAGDAVFSVAPWDLQRDILDDTYGPRLAAELARFYAGVGIFFWGPSDGSFEDCDFVLELHEAPRTLTALAAHTPPEAWARALAGLALPPDTLPQLRAIYTGGYGYEDKFGAVLLCGVEVSERAFNAFLLACRGKTKRELKGRGAVQSEAQRSDDGDDDDDDDGDSPVHSAAKRRRVDTGSSTFHAPTFDETVGNIASDEHETAFLVSSEFESFFRDLTTTFCFVEDDCDFFQVWIEVADAWSCANSAATAAAFAVPPAWAHVLRLLELPPATEPHFSVCRARLDDDGRYGNTQC